LHHPQFPNDAKFADSWDIIVNGYTWVILFFFSGVIRQIIKSLTKEKKEKKSLGTKVIRIS